MSCRYAVGDDRCQYESYTHTIGLKGRGRIEKGAFADLVIFDAAAIHDEATLEQPRQKAKGIETVLVNGKVTYEKGHPTTELPGHVLRAFRG